MKDTVNIHEAKTHLSRLLVRVMAGEEVIIAKAGKPVARLVPYKELPEDREPGTAEGEIMVSPDFHAPLPEETLKSFEA
jgi:prevent-host-death family protein